MMIQASKNAATKITMMARGGRHGTASASASARRAAEASFSTANVDPASATPSTPSPPFPGEPNKAQIVSDTIPGPRSKELLAQLDKLQQ